LHGRERARRSDHDASTFFEDKISDAAESCLYIRRTGPGGLRPNTAGLLYQDDMHLLPTPAVYCSSGVFWKDFVDSNDCPFVSQINSKTYNVQVLRKDKHSLPGAPLFDREDSGDGSCDIRLYTYARHLHDPTGGIGTCDWSWSLCWTTPNLYMR
jgi:hypothetical protein